MKNMILDRPKPQVEKRMRAAVANVVFRFASLTRAVEEAIHSGDVGSITAQLDSAKRGSAWERLQNDADKIEGQGERGPSVVVKEKREKVIAQLEQVLENIKNGVK